MVSCQDTTEEPGLYIINFSRLNIAKLRESCWNYRIALSTSCANKAATPLGGILQWKEAGKGNATLSPQKPYRSKAPPVVYLAYFPV